ncbi:MAG: GNAT family N-acetyltransferase [Lachnospiraceae bacterium]|nr:GNAT family N-acetyltransferase [Lachnospiraceae bacterium]
MMQDILISDFSEPTFQQAFKEYFEELGINVKDWDGLFKEMNDEKDNKAYVRIAEDNTVVGFILFKLIELSNWFFREKLGFVREFWISSQHRSQGHGAELLQLAEEYFLQNDIRKAILTTDTAERFYEKNGYRKDNAFTAANQDEVFVKNL